MLEKEDFFFAVWARSRPEMNLPGPKEVILRNYFFRPFYLTGEVFGELLDKEKFIQYGLPPPTIEWANGADLAPEFLYEIGTAA